MNSFEQADNNRRFKITAEELMKLHKAQDELKAQIDYAEAQKQLHAKQQFGLEVMGVMYDKGNSYTNLVMAAGYAAYFAMWENTKSLLPDNLLRLSGALMLISLTVFIGWEVLKMLYGHRMADRLEIVLLATVEEHNEKFEEFNRWKNIAKLRERKVWRWVNVITVPTAFLALWIHILSFAYNKVW